MVIPLKSAKFPENDGASTPELKVALTPERMSIIAPLLSIGSGTLPAGAGCHVATPFRFEVRTLPEIEPLNWILAGWITTLPPPNCLSIQSGMLLTLPLSPVGYHVWHPSIPRRCRGAGRWLRVFHRHSVVYEVGIGCSNRPRIPRYR